MNHDVIPFTGQTVDVPDALPPAAPPAPLLPHHTVNYKAIWLAYVIEGVVIAGGLYAGWEFAEKYAADDDKAWMMAIIGVIVIAVAELARVPLAQLAAGHKNMARKILAVIGVLMMCAVTVKSLSQVMEQMFHPRLHEVNETRHVLTVAQANLGKLEGDQIAPSARDKAKANKITALDVQINEREKNLRGTYGPRPPPKTVPDGGYRDRKGRWHTRYKTITPPWAGDAERKAIDALIAEKSKLGLAQEADQTQIAAKASEIGAQKLVIVEAQKELDGAISNSQLHSFTAMVFGKAPLDVTEGELHWFLRIFVFLPAIMIATASTILAFCAYETNKQPAEKTEPQTLVITPSLNNHMARLAKVQDWLDERKNRFAKAA